MGIVRLHHDGRVEVIDPGTPEEQARGEEKLERLIEALARQAARRDFDLFAAQYAANRHSNHRKICGD